MVLANEPSELEKASSPATVYDGESKVYFQVFRGDPNLFQTEYQMDVQGNEVFRHTEKIEYAIGSGAEGTGYPPAGQLFV